MSKAHKKQMKETSVTSAPKVYSLDPASGIWIDLNGNRFRLDTHGTHKNAAGEDTPNRLDLVPIPA